MVFIIVGFIVNKNAAGSNVRGFITTMEYSLERLMSENDFVGLKKCYNY